MRLPKDDPDEPGGAHPDTPGSQGRTDTQPTSAAGGPSAKVAGIREAWRRRLDERPAVGPDLSDWKFLGACTAPDLDYAAGIREAHARANAASAGSHPQRDTQEPPAAGGPSHNVRWIREAWRRQLADEREAVALEQEAVALIVKLRQAGESYRAVAAALDAKKLKPRRAASWSAAAVRNIALRELGAG